MNIIPVVTDFRRGREYTNDIYSRLLDDNIIFLSGTVQTEMAELIVAQMLYLEYRNPNATIWLYVNSGGGSVDDGNSILSIMDYIRCDVGTLITGQASSMAAVIASSGTKGKRYIFRSGNAMIHQIRAGNYGTAPDIAIAADKLEKMNETLVTRLAKNANKQFSEVFDDTSRDYHLNPFELVDYGLADFVL